MSDVRKGLEFPVVALPGVKHMPAPGEDKKVAARVFYVAATRATQRLVMGVGGGVGGGFGEALCDLPQSLVIAAELLNNQFIEIFEI